MELIVDTENVGGGVQVLFGHLRPILSDVKKHQQVTLNAIVQDSYVILSKDGNDHEIYPVATVKLLASMGTLETVEIQIVESIISSIMDGLEAHGYNILDNQIGAELI